MKSIYGIILLAFIATSMTLSLDKATIYGTIKDASGEVLIGANVTVKGMSMGRATDIDGNYSLSVDPGKHELEVSYTGYSSKIIEIEIKAGEKREVNAVLEEAVLMDEVVVTSASRRGKLSRAFSSSKPRGKKRNSESKHKTATCGHSTAEQIKNLPTRNIDAVARLTKGLGSSPESEVSEEAIVFADTDLEITGVVEEKSLTNVLHFKTDVSTKILDGIVVSKNLVPMAPMNALDVIVMKNKLIEQRLIEPTEKKDPKAGQLTAGEWSDLNNWKDWEKLQKDSEFKRAIDDWEMDMSERYSVLIENKNGQPLADVPVQLLNENKKIVWQARTDNFGKAELWANVFDDKNNDQKFQIKATYAGEAFSIKKAKQFSEKGLSTGKINTISIDRNCNVTNNLDIMMIVDATGSMSDEIAYLKSELKSVIRRVQKDDDELNIRLGSVFYRDKGDAYVTRQTPLSVDIQETIEFINDQKAGGGGDFPEAVDAALEEAIENQDWSEDAVARIAFLVLDAPPHTQVANLLSLEKTIQKAAEKGIKIIPITASGINKTTEYLMKFLATGSNSTYVFITDDSGIGNAHLKPTASKYEIEKLNDLMVRLIKKYADRSSCEQQQDDPLAFQTNPNNQTSTVSFQTDNGLLKKVKYFPNPATAYVTIQLQESFSSVSIINANGQEVKRYENLSVGEKEIDVSNLSEGFYVIRFKKDKTVASGKLVVIKP